MHIAPEVSEENFWSKLFRYAKAAGRQLVESALCLYYAAQHPEMPAWARSTAFGALAYFIMPVDAVPDFVPTAGFADDLTVLLAALALVAAYITDDVVRRAKQKAAHIFGEDQSDSHDWPKAA